MAQPRERQFNTVWPLISLILASPNHRYAWMTQPARRKGATGNPVGRPPLTIKVPAPQTPTRASRHGSSPSHQSSPAHTEKENVDSVEAEDSEPGSEESEDELTGRRVGDSDDGDPAVEQATPRQRKRSHQRKGKKAESDKPHGVWLHISNPFHCLIIAIMRCRHFFHGSKTWSI